VYSRFGLSYTRGVRCRSLLEQQKRNLSSGDSPIRRSISFPIAAGIFSVALSTALLVGWILVIVQNFSRTDEIAQASWLLALGSASFISIITVLVLFCVFLVREIRMVNRQTGFIDSVTHELKSPLASLKLFLGTLARDDLAPRQREEVQRMMVEDVDRLSIFIDDVLEASRLSHPWEGHALTEVVLSELVEGIVESLLRYYKQPAESVEIEIPDDLVLQTDQGALEIVVKNLLDNALKYSQGLQRPVEVTVRAHGDERQVHIEITDRGVGIPPKYRKKIFERFFRVPHETVRTRHGIGLGLFVVSAIVRVLGGKLKIHSDGVHEGTVARISLPLKKRDRKDAATREAHSAGTEA
jgi:signal transduction histidine kinase